MTIVRIADVESTGFDSPEVIEVCHALLDPEITKCSDYAEPAFHQFYRPNKAIQWGAMATHHILPSDLEHAEPSSTFSLPVTTFLVGHNIDYDWEVMGKPQCDRICTLALCRDAYPDLDSHKQSSVYYYLFGANYKTRDKIKNAHSAKHDVDMCFDILRKLIEHYTPESWEELYNISQEARVPKKMTFGKHVGDTFYEVPTSYLQWILRQPDFDPWVVVATQRELKNRRG